MLWQILQLQVLTKGIATLFKSIICRQINRRNELGIGVFLRLGLLDNKYFARGHWFHHPYKLVLFLKILEISQINL